MPRPSAGAASAPPDCRRRAGSAGRSRGGGATRPGRPGGIARDRRRCATPAPAPARRRARRAGRSSPRDTATSPLRCAAAQRIQRRGTAMLGDQVEVAAARGHHHRPAEGASQQHRGDPVGIEIMGVDQVEIAARGDLPAQPRQASRRRGPGVRCSCRSWGRADSADARCGARAGSPARGTRAIAA